MNAPDLDRARSHRPRLVMTHDVGAQVHGAGPMGRFNQRLAVAITSRVGTMWTAYLFGLLALISLPAALASRDVIIIVGQNVIQTANDARAQADHETLTAIHRLSVEIHAINETQTKILHALERGRT